MNTAFFSIDGLTAAARVLAVLALAAVAAALPGRPAQAQTAHTVPADSPLVPTEVGPGQSFRLLFVTSTKIIPTSSDIATYNTFVQNAANNNPLLRPFKGEFRAVISTDAMDARNNTAATRTDVPIYWTGGMKAADDYADFYDNYFDSGYRGVSIETGALRTLEPRRPSDPPDDSLDWTDWWVWTGSNADGTKHATSYAGPSPPSGRVQIGSLNYQVSQRMSRWGDGFKPTAAFSLYALSPVLTVGPDDARPAKPEDLTARGGDRQVTLSWTNPDDRTIVKYHQVQKKTAGGVYSEWTDIPGSGKSTTSHVVKNLSNGTTYFFKIRAKDRGGPGDESDEVSAMPVATTITPPVAQTVSEDWSLIPKDSDNKPLFTAGQSFRLLFITSTTRNAQSADIADYNRFVQTAAGRNTNLVDFKGEFRALISTATVDARDNTATTGGSVPIYWLGGEMVASGYADFYDGSWASSAGKNESGGDHSGPVWSGSNPNGTKHTYASNTRFSTAGSTDVSMGDASNLALRTLHKSWGPGDDGVLRPGPGALSWPIRKAGERSPLYALSPVLQVEDSGEPGREGETGSVEAPAEGALTARVSNAPAEHRGKGKFTLSIAFSETVAARAKDTAATVRVTGGMLARAIRVDGRKDLWELRVQPAGHEAVTVTLPATADCASAGAVCTEDGRKLENALTVTVQGPPTLSVADARAQEGVNDSIDFAVTLSRAASEEVTVRYATKNGTAKAGKDYRKTKGTLTFAAGETEKTVSVPVLDDAHDEGEETFTLVLKKATGAIVADGEATGTIENSDPLQQAWLARFGRTVATHVTDAVGDRLRASPGQGSYLTIGGSRLPLGQREESDQPSVLEAVAGVLGLGGTGAGTPATGFSSLDHPDPRLGQSRTLNVGDRFRLREILLGSSFQLNLNAADAGASLPRLTAWGRFAGTTFDGQEGTLSLDGDVFTGTVGVDGTWDRLLAGVAVAHSRGEGSFTMPGTEDRGRGDLEQTLTSLHPYVRYAVTDRLDVWGLVGYGWGELDLEMANGETLETDTNLVIGAVGGRGILLTPAEAGGFQLATRTDAMLTRTSADAVTGLAGADADAHRLRLILEGSRSVAWADGRSLTPSVELGLRHDWGDAETGFGLEVGGRVRYADPRLGLTIEGAVRGLVAHEDADYEEWGASGTLRLDPGASGQGLALTLAPTWGAASSGVDGLWSRQTTQGLAPQDTRRAPAGRLAADVGYGVPLFDTGLLTPYAGTVLADGAARTYRLGTRLQMTGRGAADVTLNLEGMRQEPAGRQPVNQGVQIQATWGF